MCSLYRTVREPWQAAAEGWAGARANSGIGWFKNVRPCQEAFPGLRHRVLCACTRVNAFLSYAWQHWGDNLLPICYWISDFMLGGTGAMVMAEEHWESQWLLNSIPSIHQNQTVGILVLWGVPQLQCQKRGGRRPLIALPWGSYRMTLRSCHPDLEYSCSNHILNPLFF